MQASSAESGMPTGKLGIRKSATVNVPPDKVWSTIGDFSGIADWHPVVESCVIEERSGAKVRVLTLKGGAELVEQLVDWDDAARSYTYTILSGPLPVSSYLSTISVTAEGTGSRLDWQGTFDPEGVSHDEATGVISGVYESGLAALVEASS